MAGGVSVDRDVQLHGYLVVLEKQALDVLHLCPVRAAVLPADADVVEAAKGGSDNPQGAAVDGLGTSNAPQISLPTLP